MSSVTAWSPVRQRHWSRSGRALYPYPVEVIPWWSVITVQVIPLLLLVLVAGLPVRRDRRMTEVPVPRSGELGAAVMEFPLSPEEARALRAALKIVPPEGGA